MGLNLVRSPLPVISSCACLLLLWICGSAVAVPSKDSLGIAPQDVSYYKSNVIKCKDGSKKFTREQLNDEFCDCPDGTDEPGTSACPEGKFYCQNAGHTPLTIFSSRVNDGICDCCDGSDEYDNNVNCPNTCWEAGKAAREKLKKKIETYQNGVIIRKQEVEKAKQAFAKDESDLSKLKDEEKILKELVQKLKDHKERIEKAEEEERLRKEKEEKALREAEKKTKEQGKEGETPVDGSDGTQEKDEASESLKQEPLQDSNDDTIESENGDTAKVDLSATPAMEHEPLKDSNDDTIESENGDKAKADLSATLAMEHHVIEDHDDAMKSEVAADSKSGEAPFSDVSDKGHDGSHNTEGLSKEELGRLVASRWTGEDVSHKTEEGGSTVSTEVHHDIPSDAPEEDYDGYTSEVEEDRHKYDDEHKYDDDDFEDDQDDKYVEDHVTTDEYKPDEIDQAEFSDLSASTSLSWVEKIQQKVQNVLQAFNFFRTPVDLSEADRIRKEYDDSNTRLTKVQSRISSLTEKLKHDFGKEKEFYSFYDHCFESKQNKYVYKVCPFKQASQVEGHSNTRLGQWEKFDESYRIMEFSNGDRCWNGPDRSLKVRLRCGLKNELTDIDEPSRCEYVAMLSTPALCLEDKLKELQQKLEVMNARQPQSHDEL